MDAKEAYEEVTSALDDWGSLLETFDPEDRSYQDETTGEWHDRLEQYRLDEALPILLAAAERAS